MRFHADAVTSKPDASWAHHFGACRYGVFLTYRNGDHQQIESAGTFISKATAEKMANTLNDVFKEAERKQ